MGQVLVEGHFRVPTTMGIRYFVANRTFTIDMEEAKKCGAWKHFVPHREVPEAEEYDRKQAELEEREKRNADAELRRIEAEREASAKKQTRGKTISTSPPARRNTAGKKK